LQLLHKWELGVVRSWSLHWNISCCNNHLCHVDSFQLVPNQLNHVTVTNLRQPIRSCLIFTVYTRPN
jgi:hypothetical protein